MIARVGVRSARGRRLTSGEALNAWGSAGVMQRRQFPLHLGAGADADIDIAMAAITITLALVSLDLQPPR